MEEHKKLVELLALLRNRLNYSYDTIPMGAPIG